MAPGRGAGRANPAPSETAGRTHGGIALPMRPKPLPRDPHGQERLPPRPLRYRGRGFGAKAPLRKPKFISAFLPQARLSPRPFASSKTEVRGCRSGFSRDPCVIENQGLGVARAVSVVTLASSRRKVRGESPSYRNHLFVGAASAATFASSKTRGWELPERLPPQPLHLRRQRCGAKARPAKGWISARGGRRERRGLA